MLACCQQSIACLLGLLLLVTGNHGGAGGEKALSCGGSAVRRLGSVHHYQGMDVRMHIVQLVCMRSCCWLVARHAFTWKRCLDLCCKAVVPSTEVHICFIGHMQAASCVNVVMCQHAACMCILYFICRVLQCSYITHGTLCYKPHMRVALAHFNMLVAAP